MNIKNIIKLNTGGQWITSPAAEEQIFCREMFSQEHIEIKEMVYNFAENKILPKINEIEKLDEKLSK